MGGDCINRDTTSKNSRPGIPISNVTASSETRSNASPTPVQSRPSRRVDTTNQVSEARKTKLPPQQRDINSLRTIEIALQQTNASLSLGQKQLEQKVATLAQLLTTHLLQDRAARRSAVRKERVTRFSLPAKTSSNQNNFKVTSGHHSGVLVKSKLQPLAKNTHDLQKETFDRWLTRSWSRYLSLITLSRRRS